MALRVLPVLGYDALAIILNPPSYDPTPEIRDIPAHVFRLAGWLVAVARPGNSRPGVGRGDSGAGF